MVLEGGLVKIPTDTLYQFYNLISSDYATTREGKRKVGMHKVCPPKLFILQDYALGCDELLSLIPSPLLGPTQVILKTLS